MHLNCTGESVTRYEYALNLNELTAKSIDLLPITGHNDVRPVYSSLDNMMLRINNLPEPINWLEALTKFLQDTNN